MAGRIHDIDAVFLPADGGILRQNRDSAFSFLVIRVHHPLGNGRARVQRAGLLQQLIHQRCLTVVNMGNNGDVTKPLDIGH